MRLAMTRSWIRACRLPIAVTSRVASRDPGSELAGCPSPSRPELRREILEVFRDVGKIVLGLEVARLLRAVFVGAGDKRGLHAVLGRADESVGMGGDHHDRTGIVVAEEMDRRLVRLRVG